MTPKVAHGQAIFFFFFMFFPHLSPIKVKLVDKMMQSTYLCIILHVKLKKLLILTVLTWSLILDKIQDRGGDGDHVWWRHRSPAAPPPIKYTRFCGENQRISTEGKSFRNTATDQKPCGGGGPSASPHHLSHGWGMTLHVCSRVQYDSLHSWNMTLEFFWTTGFPPFLSRRCDRHKLNFDWENRTFAPLSLTLLNVIHALVVVISCGLCCCLYFW